MTDYGRFAVTKIGQPTKGKWDPILGPYGPYSIGPHGARAGTFGSRAGPKRFLDQKVLGMPKFPKSSFKCLVTSEVTRTKDPHQQMRNEIIV